MAAPGFNPMTWDCEKRGCFNVLRRPKIEVFADCFPRKCNFGDVDGLIELSGHFCLLEWKGDGGSLRAAQEISFKRFTSMPGNFVIVVEGNAETMQVKRMSRFWAGRQRGWRDVGLDAVKEELCHWASWAEAEKARCE